MTKVGINGFGRIGRLAARIILGDFSDKLDLVCINTSGNIDVKGWAYLFKYDSVYGRYPGEVKTKGEKMIVENKEIPVLGQRDPSQIPWGRYGTQIVIESTGVFRERQQAAKHLRNSVKKVVISAPSKGKDVPMYVIGVNEKEIGKEKIFSCASCTTNCSAVVIKIIDQNFIIEKALMSTIHAYTSNQEILDGSHKKDLRRGRAAAVNIVPTTTGAAKATGEVYPQVKEIFDGIAIRVPVVTGSLTCLLYTSPSPRDLSTSRMPSSA